MFLSDYYIYMYCHYQYVCISTLTVIVLSSLCLSVCLCIYLLSDTRMGEADISAFFSQAEGHVMANMWPSNFNSRDWIDLFIDVGIWSKVLLIVLRFWIGKKKIWWCPIVINFGVKEQHCKISNTVSRFTCSIFGNLL